MSEPIFRAFNNTEKKWIEHFFVNRFGFVLIEKQYEKDNDCFCDYLADVDAVLCRSAGLKDKHGKMIFEFDIVKGHYGARNSIECGYVFYKKEYLQYYAKDAFSNEFCLHSFDQSPYRKIDIEIIGNIFENPNFWSKNNE